MFWDKKEEVIKGGIISRSQDANPNYLCKIVQLSGVQKHPNLEMETDMLDKGVEDIESTN